MSRIVGEDAFGNFEEDGRKSHICDEDTEITLQISDEEKRTSEEKREVWISNAENKKDAGTKLQIRKEKRTSEDTNEKFAMKNNCEMKHEGDRRWNYNEDNGNATCLLSGHCKTKRAARKHNLCSEEEFECLRKRQKISISWDMESNETDQRESMKKLNCQVSMHPNVFGYHFQRPVLESRGKMEDPRKNKTDTVQDEHNIQVQHHNWISRCNPEIMEQSESCHMKGIPEMRGHIGDAIGDGQNSLLQIHDGVERTFKSAQRRSRKGTPFRRLRGDSTKCKEEKDEMPAVEDIVMNGFLSKRSPNNEEHDNWLGNTSLEYRKLMTISEPEQKSHEEKRDNTRYHKCHEKTDYRDFADQEKKEPPKPLDESISIYSALKGIQCMPNHSKAHVSQEAIQHPRPGNFNPKRMITKDHIMYGKHLLNQEFLSLNEKERNEQKHTNLGHHLTGNQNIMNGGMRFTDPRINSDATTRSQLPVDRAQCKQGRTAAFIMEHNMADQRGREIPLYSPGRYKTMTSDDMLWHHRKLRSVAMENGKRQFVPEANYHYTSPSRAQVIPLSYPWAYLGNIPPVMYPVQANYRNSGHLMTRDRFRVDPRLLKGKYEQTYSRVLPLNKDSQSSNSEEDDGESMGRAEQMKRHVIKQENSDGQTMGKEEAYSLALLLNNESTSDCRSSNSEEDDGHMQTCNTTIASENAGQRMDHPHHQNNFQETRSTVEDQSEGGDRQSKYPHSVCVDSLTGLNTSESNHPPVIPNHKSASNGYSHHPSKKNQAQEEDAERGSPGSNNPWGKGSYSDLITMALMSSPEGKMKLNEIYRWITMNIPYFRNKGDEISSSGWKNSIRHTLSVRQRFVRLPRVTNESVSHKSWWTLSDDFLRKRPALGASSKKPSMPVTNEKYVSKETQTLEFVCGRCSRAIFKK